MHLALLAHVMEVLPRVALTLNNNEQITAAPVGNGAVVSIWRELCVKHVVHVFYVAAAKPAD
jgi:hypothetical protein